jgi:hypothetical protein
MKIIGVKELSDQVIQEELAKGAKLVRFHYCISALILTFRRSSEVYFIKKGESTFFKALPYTAIALIFGWWGIPWGPIYTISSLITNINGGQDVTKDLLG